MYLSGLSIFVLPSPVLCWCHHEENRLFDPEIPVTQFFHMNSIKYGEYVKKNLNKSYSAQFYNRKKIRAFGQILNKLKNNGRFTTIFFIFDDHKWVIPVKLLSEQQLTVTLQTVNRVYIQWLAYHEKGNLHSYNMWPESRGVAKHMAPGNKI